jgi:transcriptional regulator with XRE-family HTH domain
MKNTAQLVGLHIKQLREQRGWYQSDLANAAGLPVRTVGRIERGDVDVRLSTLTKIAKALKTSIKDLLP